MTTRIRSRHEPLRATVTRNLSIAIVASTVVAVSSSHSSHPIRWPIAFVLMLWPTFGGHWLELWYLDWLRPRLPSTLGILYLARLAAWFVGGCLLGLGMSGTTRVLGVPSTRLPAWWLAGLAFIGIELIVHAGLQVRGKASFYNGRG